MKWKLLSLITQTPKEMRAGWAKSFKTMAKKGDDVLLDIGYIENSWDENEWKW